MAVVVTEGRETVGCPGPPRVFFRRANAGSGRGAPCLAAAMLSYAYYGPHNIHDRVDRVSPPNRMAAAVVAPMTLISYCGPHSI